MYPSTAFVEGLSLTGILALCVLGIVYTAFKNGIRSSCRIPCCRCCRDDCEFSIDTNEGRAQHDYDADSDTDRDADVGANSGDDSDTSSCGYRDGHETQDLFDIIQDPYRASDPDAVATTATRTYTNTIIEYIQPERSPSQSPVQRLARTIVAAQTPKTSSLHPERKLRSHSKANHSPAK